MRWILTVVVALLVSYFTTPGTMQTRLSVAETQIQRLREDITEIKGDVKSVLRAGR